MFKWQEFVNRQLSLPDVESSEWSKDKLEASTDANLLVQINQSLQRLPAEQRGGVSLWFALAISIDANDTENKRLVTDYIQNHRLSDTPNEDVAISASCYVAAVQTLKLQDVPSDTVELFLKSMGDCQCEEFKSIVSALLGNFHACGVNTSDAAVQLAQLNIFVTKLTARYRALLAGKKWPAAASSPVGGYNAQARLTSQNNGGDLVQPSPRWQQWFDRQYCPDCKRVGHPQKYCKDRGARNRPYRPSSNRSNSSFIRSKRNDPRNNPNSNLTNRKPTFKTSRKEFNKAVHKAWLEHIEESDHDLVAHLAGADNDKGDDEPEMYVNVAGADDDNGTDESGDGEGNDNEDEANVLQALAAAGLESLNW